MGNIRIELDSEGIRSLLKSPEISKVCEQEAARMTRATGMKYVPDVYVGKTRVAAGGYQKGNDGK